jgi:DNA helicase II / ATP-dependent DNA helicase PcrA
MTTPFNLNAEQAAAVTAPVGPILVRAGAGSGKTRVLTLRIGHLIERERAQPAAILAVTFTNKAANELRERLRAQMGNRSRGVVAGTFHSVGLRILRESIEGRVRPYLRSFTVFGPDEQLQLAAESLDSLAARPPVAIDPADVLRRVSRLKSRLITPDIAQRTAADDDEHYTAALYRAYQRKLTRQNAIDFDDCIVLPLRLFNEHPDVLESYGERWRHVLVDEYQDTDRAQYALLEALSRRDDNAPRSLFAVGDSQQSIYAFRNADHTIITRFREDFPDALVVDLRTNYRSRQEILDAAYAVIRHAQSVEPLLLQAHGRARLPEAALGIQSTPDARAEADGIAAHAGRLIARGRRPSEIAVLFRTGFMSRQFEQAMRAAHVPYKVRGADSFYDRAVIRDALAYLRAIHNPADSLSLTRIANKPARGLGATTLEQIARAGAALGLSLGEAIADPRCRQSLKPQAARAAATFGSMLTRWRERAATTYPPAHLLTDVLEQSGYRRSVEQNMESAAERGDADASVAHTQQGFWDMEEGAPPPRKAARKPRSERERRDDLDLLDELVTAADEHTSLGDFLGEIALLTALPDDEDETRDAVQLLTIHAAKGLEWPIVFVAGLEEGTLPHERSLADPGGVEEERRLCYVAMTRAKENLFLSWAGARHKGKTQRRSRFLDEIEAYGRERK